MDDEVECPVAASRRRSFRHRETQLESWARTVFPWLEADPVYKAPSDPECLMDHQPNTHPESPIEGTGKADRSSACSSPTKLRGELRSRTFAGAASARRTSTNLPPHLLQSQRPHRA